MMTKRVPIDTYCEKKIPTLQKAYDGLIDYVDISSVDNTEKKIISYQTIEATDAPSRAKQLLKQGDVLVSTVRPNLNAVAVVEEETENLIVGSTGYCVLRCKNNMDVRYLFNFCQSQYFIDDMSSQATGASYPAVSNGIVRSSLIPCYSIEEQRKIAEKLDTVSELLALRKQQLSKLDELVKSRFIELFDNKYSTVKIGDVFKTTSGGTPSKAHPEYYEGGTIPWLSSGEVNAGIISSVKNHITKAGVDNSSAKMIPENSVVIAMYGATAGQVGLLRVATTTNQAVCSVLPNDSYVPEYLYYAIKSKKDWMISQCAGGAQPNISQGIIRQMEIIDAPRELQQQFSAFVEQTDKSKYEIQKSLEKLETLKKALMQKYFG